MIPELPHCSLDHDYSNDRPRLRYSEGGRFVQLSFARSPAAEWNAEAFGERGGTRGKCKGFSFGSRRRLLNRLNQVSAAADLPYFLTMTLPDDVFDDDHGRLVKTAKVWLDGFVKRLVRVCPSACGIWKIEHVSRKSGVHEGKLVPHFHLLIWGLGERHLGTRYLYDREPGPEHGRIIGEVDVYEAFVDVEDKQLAFELLTEMLKRPVGEDARQITETMFNGQRVRFGGSRRYCDRVFALIENVRAAGSHPSGVNRVRFMALSDWASLAWYHVVDSHNLDHLAAGVRVERVRSWGGVRWYASKYFSKVDSEFLGDLEFGRSWGIFNRKFMPWAKMVDLDLDEETGVRLRRVARRYLENILARKVNRPYGVTLYCDVEQFQKLWARPPPAPF